MPLFIHDPALLEDGIRILRGCNASKYAWTQDEHARMQVRDYSLATKVTCTKCEASSSFMRGCFAPATGEASA